MSLRQQLNDSIKTNVNYLNRIAALTELCKKALSALNDELGACGLKEINEHPILRRHKKIAAEIETTLKKMNTIQDDKDRQV